MREPSLRQVQQQLKARIRRPDGPGAVDALELPLRPQRGVPGTARLSVYAEGYQVRMREALGEAYEAVRHIVGKTHFAEMARAYAQRHPSREYNLSFTGRHFPAWLRTQPSAQELPFLSDLASLEWAVCEAFHAFQQPPIDLSLFSSLPLDAWARARLAFQPSVGVVASPWPILDLWEARARPRDTIDIGLEGRPQRVLVFRQALRVRCRLIDEPHAALLEGLLTGRPLGALCDELAARYAEAPLPIADWCAQWIRAGLIVACRAGASGEQPAVA